MTRLTDAQRDLAAGHYKLAFLIAGPYARRSPAHAPDFYSDALLALVDAASRFDPSRGLRFSTLASRRIRWAMVDRVYFLKGRRLKAARPDFGPIEDEPADVRPRPDPDFPDWFAAAAGDARGAEALYRLAVLGETEKEAADAIGTCPSWAKTLSRRAAASVRRKLEAEALA